MEKPTAKNIMSSTRDNRKRGSVGQFLIDNILPGSDLSIVSAYFTIYAYHNLKAQCKQIRYSNSSGISAEYIHIPVMENNCIFF